MAQTIQIKSSTGATNTPASLATGELAINVTTGSLFYGSATTVHNSFTFGTLAVTGNTTLTGDIDVDGTTNLDAVDVDGDITMANSQQLFLGTSNESNPAITFLADTDTGLRLNAAGSLRLTVAGADQIAVSDGAVYPVTDSDVDLGLSSGYYFKDLYIDSINCGGDISGATLDISGDADIDGTTNLDAVDIDGTVQVDNTITVGVDDTGYDVKFFGATSGRFLLWDEANDRLKYRDNVKAVFGTNNDLEIYHDATDNHIEATNTLNIATANSGIAVNIGHTTSETTVNDNLSVTGTLKANRSFEKSSTTDKNLAQGDIVYVGTGSTVEGDLVMMHSAGTWTSAQANDVRSGTTMLGIALGTDPDVDGVLLRGTYTLDHDVGINVGVPLYLSDGTAGQATTTIPDSSGDIVRVIGYTLANDDEIWFDPDKTWVELS